jgi:hypothetical protein
VRRWFFALTALSLFIGWRIRGNFGHEFGAMIPGALATIAVALLSGRADRYRRMAQFGLFGALGWSFGVSMSYMQVTGYTHSGHSPSVLYGFACLFVIGFLWAAVGGAGTVLPACETLERLNEFFIPLAVVCAAWWIEWRVVDVAETLHPAWSRSDPFDWYDTNWLDALVAPATVMILGAVRRRIDRASSHFLSMAAGWWAGFLVLAIGLGLRTTPPRGDNWAGSFGMVLAMLIWFTRARQAPVVLASLVAGNAGGFGFATATLIKFSISSSSGGRWRAIWRALWSPLRRSGW